jgi:hypothetical protein
VDEKPRSSKVDPGLFQALLAELRRDHGAQPLPAKAPIPDRGKSVLDDLPVDFDPNAVVFDEREVFGRDMLPLLAELILLARGRGIAFAFSALVCRVAPPGAASGAVPQCACSSFSLDRKGANTRPIVLLALAEVLARGLAQPDAAPEGELKLVDESGPCTCPQCKRDAAAAAEHLAVVTADWKERKGGAQC